MAVAPVVARPHGRRRPSQAWLPRQHGAWAMLVVPPVVGATLAGWTWRHALLLAAWLVGFLAYHAAGLWLRSGRRARYRTPLAVHGAAGAALLAALLLTSPRLLVWAPVFAPLLTVSLVASLRRADRSWWNDTVTVLAAALLLPVAAGLGAHGLATGRLVTATGVVAAYFLGTIPYVKSLIRDRDDPRVRWVSVAYHALLAVAAWWVGAAVGVVALLLLARAVVVPWRWPRVRPAFLGAGEVVASVVVSVTVLLTI